MEDYNKKKNELLGEPHGTANAKLRKAILFQLLQETGKNICFRCGEEIGFIEDLSIEHIKPWMSAENPKEAFFDLKNISFSHLLCNNRAGEKKVPHPNIQGENHPRSKLTQKQVEEIREELDRGRSLIALSQEYFIDESTVRAIRDNRIWKYS
jgi:hypothetical protein